MLNVKYGGAVALLGTAVLAVLYYLVDKVQQ
jgi:uncharacterized membrane protein